MFNFFRNKKENKTEKNDIKINEIYAKLKEICSFDEISDDRKSYLKEKIEKYGYLPYPHIKALEELTPAEVLLGLEIKWGLESVFVEEKFNFNEMSPLARAEVKTADWIKKEGHEIKLINLAGLGNGNIGKTPGKFFDWLRQLLILPSGSKASGIFPTTIYLVPFHPRAFGCAYLPTSTDVSPHLEDEFLKEKLGLDAKGQVQFFINLAQLAGHPVIYDILPQTGRFAKMVLANPYIARWFDVKELISTIDDSLDSVSKKLEKTFDKEDIDKEDVEIVKNIFKQETGGELSEDYKKIYDKFEEELKDLKKTYSIEMSKKESQIKLQKRVSEIVAQVHGEKIDKRFKEEEITKQEEVVKTLMQEGLWSAPGGAWCSAGVPIFDKMSDCGTYPIFNHYDFKGEDVSEFANLDCQTPFYFVFLENGQYNKPVVEFFTKYIKDLRQDYNFDGFRIDHVDHVVDEVSQKKGVPISYRIPEKVLGELNSALKIETPYFASLAEYMGTQFCKEYNENMRFDVLWGNDISAQYEKTPEKIVEDNQNLVVYNTKSAKHNLSILKTYNNQDGEFQFIDQYPGQLEEEGALFKWFKYKFLPGGKDAQRPILYVDGDESFTKIGIEKTIGNEISMVREKNYEFFAKFDAISRFAKSQQLVTEGEAQIIEQDEEGFVSWMISKEPLKTALLVIANYQAPMEQVFIEDEEGVSIREIKEGEDVCDKKIFLPCDYEVSCEYVFDGVDFVEKEYEGDKTSLEFELLEPGEFHIYLLSK